MRHIEGFVFHAIMHGRHFIFGKGRGEGEHYSNLTMNRITPYNGKDQAEEGYRVFVSKNALKPRDSMAICRFKMDATSFDGQEIEECAKRWIGEDLIIIGEMDLGVAFFGLPPTGAIGLGHEELYANGFRFYNRQAYPGISPEAYLRKILRGVSEVRRRMDTRVQLATIDIKEV